MKIICTTIISIISMTQAIALNREHLFDYDYSRVYQEVEAYKAPKSASVEEVTQRLVSFGNNQHEKAFAIYLWLALNIDYDYTYTRYYAKETFECISGKRSGVCNGFSLLFVDMCSLAGLEAKKLSGLAKGAGYEPKLHYNDSKREQIKSSHAWNAVKLYGQWHLVEATWASCIRTPEYIRKYWLADPYTFAYEHLPLKGTYNYDLKKWEYSEIFEEQYSPNPIDYYEFARVDDNTMKEYVFYEEDEDSDPFTGNDLAREALASEDFDALNELDRLIKTKTLPYIEHRGSELFLQFKEYYVSGALHQDLKKAKETSIEFWNSEDMEIIKDKSKQSLIEGLETVIDWLD